MNFNLNKLTSVTIAIVLLFAVAIITPGTLFIFIFSRELFIELETLKLILLAISITLPIWVLNTYAFASLGGEWKKDPEKNLRVSTVVGSYFSIPIICIPALVKLFVDISLQIGVVIIIGLQNCWFDMDKLA